MRGAARDRERRTNDPDGVRRRILNTAFEAFTKRGYHATSVHDLKRVAGATGGALAHHFPTKKLLASAVIRDQVARAVEQTWVEPVLAARSTAEGVASVLEAIAADLVRLGVVHGCPLNNLALELSGDDDFRGPISKIFLRWRDAIAQKLRADEAAGLVANLDADALATFIVAAYSGAMAMAKASQDAAPLRLCAEQLTSMLRRRACVR